MASEQQTLEAKLQQIENAARSKVAKYAVLKDGAAKDVETSLELDFSGMRRIIRNLESLAEDQEEEEDEEVVQRLQQYKRTLQSIQTDLSNAKLQPKLDSYEDNRRQLLAGADPTQRQRELQTEAEILGAAQKTTSSLQRSRQIMAQQIENQQNILAAMDASHEQLSKTTDEYQGQSSVYGNTRQLLRTMKRHSSWDKLVLYGGFAMFLLVCLYVVQKRSLYFVPTFVKTGVGKLVPSWARLSGRNVDHLVKPVKERQQGLEGLRQQPSIDTLRNFDQAQELLQRHPAPSSPPPAHQLGQTSPKSPAADSAASLLSSSQQQTATSLDTKEQPQQQHEQQDQEQHKQQAQRQDQQQDQEQQPQQSQTEKASSIAGQAVDSAVAAADEVVQQLSVQEQDHVRAAVASAAQQLAEQQEQQAVALDAGQAYPQAQYSSLVEPQNSSNSLGDSSEAAVTQANDSLTSEELSKVNAADADESITLQQASDQLTDSNADESDALQQASDQLTDINADDADELAGLQQPDLNLEGSFPDNATNASNPPDDEERGSNKAETADASPQPAPLVSEPLHVEANQTLAVVLDQGAGGTSPKDPIGHPQLRKADVEEQGSPHVTQLPLSNATGTARPQSSAGLSTDTQQSDQITVNDADAYADGESSAAPSQARQDPVSAAVFNQTLFDQGMAALKDLVQNNSRDRAKAADAASADAASADAASADAALENGSSQPDNSSTPSSLQAGSHVEQMLHSLGQTPEAPKVDGQQHEDAVTGSTSPRPDNRSSTASLERDTVTDEQMRQSGHGDAFERIMHSIPDSIKNASSDKKSDDGSLEGQESILLDTTTDFADNTRASTVNASSERTE